MSTYTSTDDAIKAAMSIATDVADGKLAPADLEAVAVAELTELFAEVVGPDNPVWPLQLQVARGILAAGGIPADELSEWAAVQRASEEPAKPLSVPEPVDPEEAATEPGSAASEVVPEAQPQPEPVPVAPVSQLPPPQRRVDGYDPFRGWPAGRNGFVG
jgi:hypothetical protein